MTLGYIGLGKMGRNMVTRLMEKGHEVVAFDPDATARARTVAAGIMVVERLADVLVGTPGTRTVWLMVPHTVVDDVLMELMPHLVPGDTVIDGGNSNYKETIRRAKTLANQGILMLDVGTSGGPEGARTGACLMIGGSRDVYEKHVSLLRDIAAPDAYGYMGSSGAGHFVKMVHNGIEYGMMQAIAEGFAVMKAAPFNIALTEVARVYNHRSVIESRLIQWLEDAFRAYGEDLADISGKVSHSGEGLWTVQTAKELGVDVPVIEDSLRFREESQKHPSYTGQVVSALRGQFGGHPVARTDEEN